MRYLILVLTLVGLSGCNQPLERTLLPLPAFDDATLARLWQARLINGDAILAEKALLQDDPASTWLTRDPFTPGTRLSFAACNDDPNCRYALLGTGLPRLQFPASTPVYHWWHSRALAPESAQVCGVEFVDGEQTRYRLRTFANLAALEAEPDAVLTHFQACGACSSLQDLAVYGELDLTVMAKTCSKRLSLSDKKTCMQAIGFSESCAEAWAYNAQQTARACALVCVSTYGLSALLKGEENRPPVDEDGNLNPCLQCDEMMSGPGFQYSAGRTRRNSGILSEIVRPDDQVYAVPHAYF